MIRAEFGWSSDDRKHQWIQCSGNVHTVTRVAPNLEIVALRACVHTALDTARTIEVRGRDLSTSLDPRRLGIQ